MGWLIAGLVLSILVSVFSVIVAAISLRLSVLVGTSVRYTTDAVSYLTKALETAVQETNKGFTDTRTVFVAVHEAMKCLQDRQTQANMSEETLKRVLAIIEENQFEGALLDGQGSNKEGLN